MPTKSSEVRLANLANKLGMLPEELYAARVSRAAVLAEVHGGLGKAGGESSLYYLYKPTSVFGAFTGDNRTLYGLSQRLIDGAVSYNKGARTIGVANTREQQHAYATHCGVYTAYRDIKAEGKFAPPVQVQTINKVVARYQNAQKTPS